MADIKNYALNSGSGRALRALDFARAKTAFTEVQRGPWPRAMVLHG